MLKSNEKWRGKNGRRRAPGSIWRQLGLIYFSFPSISLIVSPIIMSKRKAYGSAKWLLSPTPQTYLAELVIYERSQGLRYLSLWLLLLLLLHFLGVRRLLFETWDVLHRPMCITSFNLGLWKSPIWASFESKLWTLLGHHLVIQRLRTKFLAKKHTANISQGQTEQLICQIKENITCLSTFIHPRFRLLCILQYFFTTLLFMLSFLSCIAQFYSHFVRGTSSQTLEKKNVTSFGIDGLFL